MGHRAAPPGQRRDTPGEVRVGIHLQGSTCRGQGRDPPAGVRNPPDVHQGGVPEAATGAV